MSTGGSSLSGPGKVILLHIGLARHVSEAEILAIGNTWRPRSSSLVVSYGGGIGWEPRREWR